MKLKIITLLSALSLMLTGCASGNASITSSSPEIGTTSGNSSITSSSPEIEVTSGNANITRDTTEIKVTAEKFQEETGFLFSVPEGAEDVTYFIDTETKRALMGFVLDGVLWNAIVKRSDAFEDIVNWYVRDNEEEIGCDFDSDQIMKVHGADPDVKCYRIHFADNREAYSFSAMWFLEDEGFMISLVSFSENPVHTMPVEVFGSM